MARIIAISNQKGGVGKTTTAISLGAALAQRDNQVLLVDIDPRADLSGYLGVNLAPDASSVYHALFDDGVSMEDIIIETGTPGLDVAPASIDLAGAEMLLIERPAEQRHSALADALNPVADRYDYVLVDSPPGLQLLSISALVAAGEVLVPQQCSFIALRGLRQLSDNVERIRAELNPDLHICGIVMTMQDRRTIHNRQVIDMVKEGFGALVIDVVIPTTIRVQEAAVAGEPITVYDPASPAAAAYRELAEEVIARA